MAIKKVTTKKIVKKVTPPKNKITKTKVNPKVPEIIKEITREKEENLNYPMKPVTEDIVKPVKKSWWAVLAVLLLLILTGILLYNFNSDFRSSVKNLAGQIGLSKLLSDKDKNTTPKEKFPLNLTIVYNKEDPKQKETIDRYITNIENNLENTKVVPTWLDKNDPQGSEILTKLAAKYLPVFITDESIQKHPQYAMFAPAIKIVNGLLAFQSQGMEYLQIPEVGAAHFDGADPKTAKLVIIEYSSPTCGYCKLMNPILKKVIDKYGTEVSVVTKHYDRGGIDSLLSQSIECAGEQYRWNKMTDLIFDHQADIFSAAESTDPEAVNNEIKTLARTANANGEKVLACAKSGKYADLIKQETAEGQEFGVIGTPSLFVGKKFIGGAMEETAFMSLIDTELTK